MSLIARFAAHAVLMLACGVQAAQPAVGTGSGKLKSAASQAAACVSVDWLDALEKPAPGFVPMHFDDRQWYLAAKPGLVIPAAQVLSVERLPDGDGFTVNFDAPAVAGLQAFSRARIGKFVAVRVGDQLMAVAQVRGPFGKGVQLNRPLDDGAWQKLRDGLNCTK